MEEFISKLKNDLQKELSSEIIVDDIYFYEENKNKFLTVVVDKIGGIDLDGVVLVSKVISEILDKTEVPVDNYILDVISKERGNENE